MVFFWVTVCNRSDRRLEEPKRTKLGGAPHKCQRQNTKQLARGFLKAEKEMKFNGETGVGEHVHQV